MSKQRSEDRASLCSFTFADGRHCRMLRARNTNYCLHHLQKVGGADPTVSYVRTGRRRLRAGHCSHTIPLSRLLCRR